MLSLCHLFVVSMSSLCCLYVISKLSLCHLFVVSMSSLCCLYVISLLSLCHLFVVSMSSLCCLYLVSMMYLCRLYVRCTLLPSLHHSIRLQNWDCPQWVSNSRPSDYATDMLPTVLWKHSQKMKTAAWLPTLVLDSIYIRITYWLRIFSSVTLFQCNSTWVAELVERTAINPQV